MDKIINYILSPTVDEYEIAMFMILGFVIMLCIGIHIGIEYSHRLAKNEGKKNINNDTVDGCKPVDDICNDTIDTYYNDCIDILTNGTYWEHPGDIFKF